jgi:hypothetical protein
VLQATTGLRLTRAKPAPAKPKPAVAPRPRMLTPTTPAKRKNRLVQSPVFILTSIRSGSTLLRMILDSHSAIRAPHELHLTSLHVTISETYGAKSMKELGLDQRKLEHLLWDRLLDRELAASGKRIIVEKTPNILFEYERILEAWPKARFIFLTRHPRAIMNSISSKEEDAAAKRVHDYLERLQQAREQLEGPTVRYEELVQEPERVTQELCEFLGVPWERTMLDYGDYDHGPVKFQLGDWKEKIRSGQINSDIVVPGDDEIPELLRENAKFWGYLK